MSTDLELEAQIDRWRSYVQGRQAISPTDVDELEDHLRGQVTDLRATGLDDDEAFLIAIKRLGNLDAVSREYAREHSERLWKQLALLSHDDPDAGPAWRELAVVLGIAVAAGLAVKAGASWIPGDTGFVRNAALLVLPFVAGYFAWRRRVPARVSVTLIGIVAALAVVLNVYPYVSSGSTVLLAALHAPVIGWLVVGVAYMGGRWRSDARRMDFARFTGELAIYFALIAMGGGVLLGLTAGVLSMVDIDLEPVLENWVMPFAVPGALVVAAWLVEAKKSVVENIAPVLTKVFTPLTVIMLLTVLAALATADGLLAVDRDLLIIMDAILILVACLLLYAISARDPLARVGLFDGLQLVLVVAALAVDAVMLAVMMTRIAEFGTSPNRLAALGLNLLLLVHLIGTAWITVGFLRGKRPFASVERWQTRYLPVYGVWALLVVVAFGPIFGFA
ncbi:MAG: permease prefix domain 1-containing protein [Propionibacteriaceae bacterium]